MIANRIRRFAIRHFPFQFAAIEIDSGNDTVRRLDDRQALDIQTESATPASNQPAPMSRLAALGVGVPSARTNEVSTSTA